MDKLNHFSRKQETENDFKVTFHIGTKTELKSFKNLSSERSVNNKERGILGELVTTLTMISMGYANKHFSKFGTDNGFDGIFIDNSTKPEMFITESKCRERADGVNSIMKDNLSEEKIFIKLNRIASYDHKALSEKARSHLGKTGELITQYINQSPERIFKFAHRVKSDGSCSCLVREFDIKAYQMLILKTPTHQSPMKDKLSALNTFTTNFCSTDEEKVKLYIRSLPGSELEKLQLIFNALEIEKSQQDKMVAIFDQEKKVNRALNFNGTKEETDSEDK